MNVTWFVVGAATMLGLQVVWVAYVVVRGMIGIGDAAREAAENVEVGRYRSVQLFAEDWPRRGEQQR